MDGIVVAAMVTGVVAIVTSGIAISNQRREGRERRQAELTVTEVAAEVDKTRIVVDEWQKLYGVLDVEVKDLRVQLRECERQHAAALVQVTRLEVRIAQLEAGGA